jgi:hypothetical protein
MSLLGCCARSTCCVARAKHGLVPCSSCPEARASNKGHAPSSRSSSSLRAQQQSSSGPARARQSRDAARRRGLQSEASSKAAARLRGRGIASRGARRAEAAAAAAARARAESARSRRGRAPACAGESSGEGGRCCQRGADASRDEAGGSLRGVVQRERPVRAPAPLGAGAARAFARGGAACVRGRAECAR